MLNLVGHDLQGGPLPVLSRVITCINGNGNNGVITVLVGAHLVENMMFCVSQKVPMACNPFKKNGGGGLKG